MLDPKLYKTLVNRATTEPAKNIEEAVIERFNETAKDVAPYLTKAFRDVYTAGLKDGFVQGVQAASDDLVWSNDKYQVIEFFDNAENERETLVNAWLRSGWVVHRWINAFSDSEPSMAILRKVEE